MFLCSVKQKRLLLRSQELINVGLIREREKFVTGIQHGGVDLLAPEEFEKETGGYQSGDEGGTETSLNLGIDIQFKDPEARLSKSKEFSSKKRKRGLSNDVQLYVWQLWQLPSGSVDFLTFQFCLKILCSQGLSQYLLCLQI